MIKLGCCTQDKRKMASFIAKWELSTRWLDYNKIALNISEIASDNNNNNKQNKGPIRRLRIPEVEIHITFASIWYFRSACTTVCPLKS